MFDITYMLCCLAKDIMPNLPFTLRQLEIFSSLAGTGSFRRCAEELGISQASVSNQLKVLEEQLGIVLFDRKPGRNPLLTPEGRAFEEDLRQFYIAGEALASHRQRSSEKQRKARFRLLIGQGMLDSYVRPKLDSFLSDNPLVELDFEAMPPTADALRAVNGRRYDFGILNLREDVKIPAEMVPLALVSGGIYGKIKFAEGKSLPLSPEEVALLPFILPPVGSKQEREVLASLARTGIRPRKVVGHSQHYDVMAAMLERGVAVASFSDMILPPAMRKDVVKLMPMPSWNLMLFRKNQSPDETQQAVEDFLVEAIIGDLNYPAVEIYDPRGVANGPVVPFR